MRKQMSVLALVVLGGACYRYEPLPSPTPVVGTELRAYLTTEGASSMSTTLGRGVTVFDGRLTAEDQDVWRFAVTQTRTAEFRSVTWSGEPVSVPRAAVARMERRVLDRPKTLRTAVLVAIAGIGIGFAIKSIGGEASGDPGGNGGPPPP